MKYIIRPAVKVYGVYIGEGGKNTSLIRGAKYLIDSVTISKPGIMYVSVYTSQKPVTTSGPIASGNFELMDSYGFRYNPPFHMGLSFKYEYNMNSFVDDYGLDLPHMHVRYAFNKDSGDGVYAVYPLFNDDITIMTPLFEDTFEYSSDANTRNAIKSRMKATVSEDGMVIYKFNDVRIAELVTRNGVHTFFRHMIKDKVNEISSFSISKYKNMYMKFTSTPSKFLNEKPGFSEAIFSIRTDMNITCGKNIPIN